MHNVRRTETMTEILCPKCSKEMRRPKGLDLPVLRCSGCDGSWLGLMEIKSRLSNPPALFSALSKEGTSTGFGCPSCRDRPLSQAKYGDSEIDWCPTCKGIFFDAGELVAVRTTLSQSSSTAGTVATNVAGEAGGSIIAELIIEAVGWAIDIVGNTT